MRPGYVRGKLLAGVLLIGVLLAGLQLRGDLPAELGCAEKQRTQFLKNYGNLPLHFEPNQGQTAGQVEFLSRGRGYTLFLSGGKSVLALEGAPEEPAVLRMELAGAKPAPRGRGMDELPGKSNYFIGGDPDAWRQNVPHYARVRYEEVYPGVDLVYYGRQGQLEYDFVVAPGADPGGIALEFTGADEVKIDARGRLILRVSGGEVLQHRPHIYQEIDGMQREVAGRYAQRDDGRIGFAVAVYDAGRALVIDPVLSYSTYLGGSSEEESRALAVDAAGHAYITGKTLSADFPTANPLQATKGTGNDVFVTKLSPDGSTLIYSTYLGGSGSDIGSGIAVDTGGDAYLTGATNSTDFPAAGGIQPNFGGGNTDGFVARLDASGAALIYSTYLGGSGIDSGASIAVDNSGNAYVTGSTNATDFPIANALQSSSGGNFDSFIARLDASGAALIYSTYLGGDFNESSRGIAVDNSGNAYVTGSTNATNFPTANALQPMRAGSVADAFITKVNAQGTALVYSTYLGGDNHDGGLDIALGSGGEVYVSGTTYSGNFPLLTPLQASLSGSQDAFVAALDASGTSLIYSTYLGGSGVEDAAGIAVDNSGNAYVTGLTSSADLPLIDEFKSALGGVNGGYVAGLDATGSALLFSTYLGGSDLDHGKDIAVENGALYVTGNTLSTYFPLENPLQGTLAGGAFPGDGFVVKIALTGSDCQAGHHWPGDGNADDVADGLDGSHPSGLYAQALLGAGFAFDGSNKFEAPLNHSGPFTVAFWVRSAFLPQPAWTGILSSSAPAAPTSFQIDFSGSSEYRIHLSDGNFTVPIGAASTDFQHVVVRFDGSQVTTYLNGTPQNSASANAMDFSLLKLGENRGSTLFFEGVVDDVRFYTYALPDSCISDPAFCPTVSLDTIACVREEEVATHPFAVHVQTPAGASGTVTLNSPDGQVSTTPSPIPVTGPSSTVVNGVFIPDTGVSGSAKIVAVFAGGASSQVLVCTDTLEVELPECLADTSGLQGCKFDDLNGDGEWEQPDEPAVSGVTIELLDAQGNTVATAVTDAEGCYAFEGLTPGIYSVVEDIPGGAAQTRPSTVAYHVTLPDESGDGYDFGNFECHQETATISVTDDEADNLGTPGDTSPDPVFSAWASSEFGQVVTRFDTAGVDLGHWIHTVQFATGGCPVVGARLEVGFSKSGSASDNDQIILYQIDDNDIPQIVWAGPIGNSSPLMLDLASLTPRKGIDNILAALQDGTLDIRIQDDTGVDYVALDVDLCCNCQAMHHWPGDEHAQDVVDGVHGTHPSGLYDPAMLDEGFAFDGTNEFQVPLSYTGPFTLAFWVKSQTVLQPSSTGLVASIDLVPPISANLQDLLDSFQVSFSADGHYEFVVSTTSFPTPVVNKTIDMGSATTNFEHLVIRYDGTQVEAFRNGMPVGSPVTASTITIDPLVLGVNRIGAEPFSGIIDDVRFYDYVLPDSCIVDLVGELPGGPFRIRATFAGPARVRVGETIEVSLNMDLSTVEATLGAYEVVVQWDAAVLEFTGAESGSFGSININEDAVGEGRLIFNSFSQTGIDAMAELASLQFQVVGEEGQRGFLRAEFEEVSATADEGFHDLLPEVSVQPAVFTIAPRTILGDVDGNGRVSIRDALMVASFAAIPGLVLPDGSDIQQGDVDGNGRVSIRDALMIATFSVDPDNASLPEGIGAKLVPLVLDELEEGERVRLTLRPAADTRAWQAALRWDADELRLVGLSLEPAGVHRASGELILADVNTSGLEPVEVELAARQAVSLAQLERRLEAYTGDFGAGLVELEVERVPRTFRLYANRPNPFNPETSIRYALPQAEQVELRIYNLQGQLVRTLVSARQAVGVHEVRWNGRDEQGRMVSSGVYLYRLEAGSFEQTRRMLVLK